MTHQQPKESLPLKEAYKEWKRIGESKYGKDAGNEWCNGWIEGYRYHASRPHPAPKTPQECENRNCLECPLWEGCHVMEEMPMCARATFDNACKNAAREVREESQQRIEQVIKELEKKKFKTLHDIEGAAFNHGIEIAIALLQAGDKP